MRKSDAKYSPRPLLAPPSSLVEGGRFQLGTFDGPIQHVNPLDADVSFGPLPSALKKLRLKEWQHFALVNDDIYLSIALFDAKVLCLVQVCVYHRRRDKTIFHERKLLPWQCPTLPGALGRADVAYRSRRFSLVIANRLDEGHHEISFDIKGTRKLPGLRGRLTCFEPLDEVTPMVVCLPFSGGRAMYSHKCVVAASGELSIDGEQFEFPQDRAYGLIDIHKGYYPFVMRWHWATAGHRGDDGQVLGFNLTDNQVEDQARYNENCLWVDGALHLLPPVRFINAETMDKTPWEIRDEGGQVALTFQPEVFRTVDLHLGLLKSRYRGPFGAFHGHICDSGGQSHAVDGWFGMCENFYLRV